MNKVDRRSFLKGAAAITGAALMGAGQNDITLADSAVTSAPQPIAAAAHSAHAASGSAAAAPLTNLSATVLDSLAPFQPLPKVATNVAQGSETGPDLLQFQPIRLESKDGLLEYDLTAEFMDYDLIFAQK